MKRSRTPKGAPGITEVAARAGVSIATVSRAFNHPKLVNEPTRKRISEAAVDLGYIRDRLAGAMQSHFSGTVGLIVPTIDNAIFSELIEAFAKQLNTHDRTMLIAAHGFDLGQEVNIVRSLLERRIDGIVLIGSDHDQVPMNMLASRGVPAISIWNYHADSSIPCIGADNFEAGYQICKYLIDLGHRDIALMFPDLTRNDRARDRNQGVMKALDEAGVTVTQERQLTSHYDIGEAKHMAMELLASHPPSAVICGNDIIAQGMIYACQTMKIRVPEDISIVGIGDFRGSEHMEPALTTVRLPANKIGRLAADVIVEMSKTGESPIPFNKSIDFQLMERGSTAKAL